MDTDQILTDEKPSTCKPKREPKERPCSECGQPVLTRCYGRVLCPECRARCRAETVFKYEKSEKGAARSRKSGKKWRDSHRESYLESLRKYRAKNAKELNAKSREKYHANLEESREKAKLRQRMYRGIPGAKLEYAKIMGKAQTCPRMHVTALSLPCGKRPECWWGKPCEGCAEMKKPVNAGFNDWRF